MIVVQYQPVLAYQHVWVLPCYSPIDDYNTIGVSFDANKYGYHRPVRGKMSRRKSMKSVWTVIIMIFLPLRVFSNLSVMPPAASRKNCRRLQWSLGLEYTYHEQFSIRGGYHWEHENKRETANIFFLVQDSR